MDGDGTRRELALPRGWSAETAPPALIDPEGTTVVREGQEFGGVYASFFWQHGRPLCQIEGAPTVRMRDVQEQP